MPSVSGLGLTFNLPNYTGEVLEVTRSDTPFLSAIGGLNEQGEVIASTEFEGQTQDLGAPSQPAIVEGADAPTLTERSRGTWNNITQIFQYAFGVSYTRQAANQQLAGLAIGRQNPVTDELAYQTELQLKIAARNINYSFVNGGYQKPSDNTTGRKTRGLLEAITTNVTTSLDTTQTFTAEADDDVFTAGAAHGLAVGDVVVLLTMTGGTGASLNTQYYVITVPSSTTFKLSASSGGTSLAITVDASAGTFAKARPLSKVMVLDMVQGVWDNHGIDAGMEPTLMCNATIKRALTKLFITDAGYQEMSRSVGGVSVTSIHTDFGDLNILVERVMPSTDLVFTHLRMCKPAYLPIPNKGFLFVEPLAKSGAQEKYQLYGETGLWHGPEIAHAKLKYARPVSGA